MVDWLNYHHLLYFWMVVKEGGMTAAADALHLSQPTLSTQIQKLEKSMDVKLFDRKGRSMVLTDTGQMVFRYADEIFNLGRELTDAIRSAPTNDSVRLLVGVPDVLPKLMVYRLLQPALDSAPDGERVRLVCYEGKTNDLLSELALHRLDVVISDSPVASGSNIRAFSHLLGQCSVSVFGNEDLAAEYSPDFPASLEGAPMLLPTRNTTLRRALEQWFDERELRPETIHEFEDSALLKVFGQEGEGLITVPSAIESEVSSQYRLKLVGRINEITEQYFAISVERRLKHPAVVRMSQAARAGLFGGSQPAEKQQSSET